MTNEISISNQLASFADELTSESIPAEVRERAKYLILDAVGIAIASTRYDFSHKTLTAISGLSESDTMPVIGMPARLSVRDAAVMNGLLIHGLDFDDTHVAGVVHLTSSTFPCALSAGYKVGATGEELINAYIVGVEAGARLGAVAKGGFHQVGHHPTGVCGAFACALIAGRLMGLTQQQMEMAQGIALSVAGGSMEFLVDGAWTKRMHPGWAAQSGITAAAMAQQGFPGPKLPYEGRFGLYKSLLGSLDEQCDYSLATADLGEVWELMNIAVKPYPACHFTHACADAAQIIMKEHGLQVDQIANIRALVPEEVVKTVCEPEANKKRPANSYEAQFSIPYLVATSIIKGRFTLDELESETLTDPAILDLAAKVNYEVDPNSGFPTYYSGEVVIETTDGNSYQQREHMNRGCSDRPLTNEDIVEKFMGTAGMTLSMRKVEEIRDYVLNVEGFDDVSDLAELLTLPSAT